MATLNFPFLSHSFEFLGRSPIDFQLVDPDGNPIIWVTENPTDAHCLFLTLTNQGLDQIVYFDGQSTQSNFELSFRKGILSAKTLQFLQPGGGWHRLDKSWKISVKETSESIGILFQLQSGIVNPGGFEGIRLFRGQSIKVLLTQFSAAASEDRLTQVLFTPTGIIPPYWRGNGPSGRRRQPLAVLRRPQDSQIPFIGTLVDTQPIVNDGVTRNTVSLLVANQLDHEPLQLTPRGQADPTTLTVTFNVSDITEDSALTDIANAGKIVCETAGGSKWHAVDLTSRQGRIPEFSFTTDATSMAPQESLKIILSEIVSATAAKQASITISYENLPDPRFANGHVVVTVQKAP